MREAAGDPTTTMHGDVAVVTAAGELDFALCLKLAPELDSALRSAPRAVVIDLEAVSLVDSSGIGLVLNAFRHLNDTGRELTIACPGGSPRRAFELTALDRELPMYETLEDALAALGAS